MSVPALQYFNTPLLQQSLFEDEDENEDEDDQVSSSVNSEPSSQQTSAPGDVFATTHRTVVLGGRRVIRASRLTVKMLVTSTVLPGLLLGALRQKWRDTALVGQASRGSPLFEKLQTAATAVLRLSVCIRVHPWLN